MSSNNMLITLLGLSAFLCAFKKSNNSNVIEHFGMLPKQTVRVDRVMGSSCGANGQQAMNAKTGKYSAVGSDFYSVPGTFQSTLSPRGGAGMIDYGALVRYNMPSQGKLATPNYANMIGTKEGFCGGAPPVVEGYNVCNSGGQSYSKKISSAHSANAAKKYNALQYNEASDMLPVQNMGGVPTNALGQGPDCQPIIYDRLIFANQKNHLYGLGDPIRGDLPIAPLATGWFSPAAVPQMLRDGALAAMGGVDNETSNELLALKSAASAGVIDTGSGINYAVQKSSFASAGQGDIRVTSFP